MLQKLLALLLLQSGCTTCPAERNIANVVTSVFVRNAQCANYEAVREDIEEIVDAGGVCGLPPSIGCFLVSEQINSNLSSKLLQVSWKCTESTVSSEVIREACNKL